MKCAIKFALGLAATAALAGCVEDMANTGAPVAAPAGGPPFITTFDSAVSQAAVRACTNALKAETKSEVRIVGSEFSQANSAIYMRLASNGAPWRCLVSNDGRGPELMFMGSEGGA